VQRQARRLQYNQQRAEETWNFCPCSLVDFLPDEYTFAHLYAFCCTFSDAVFANRYSYPLRGYRERGACATG
jgi:hypothetical protein